MLSSCIRSLDLPLAQQFARGCQAHLLFRGSTPIVDDMACEANVLIGSDLPYVPHICDQEQLLIVLDGEAELTIAGCSRSEDARLERVGSGEFAYYRAGQPYSIRNAGRTPLTYLMFKWRAERGQRAPDQLRTTVFQGVAAPAPKTSRPFVTRTVFQQPTAWLGTLHCHTTRLAPRARYAAPVDAYDVAIVVQSGRVETLGQEAGRGAVIYYPAGETHEIRNIAEEPALYLVFAFHAAGVPIRYPARRRLRQLARRLLKPLVSGVRGVLPGIRDDGSVRRSARGEDNPPVATGTMVV